jgi:hypothetical protein
MPRNLGQHDKEQERGDSRAEIQKDEAHKQSPWNSLSCVLATGGCPPGLIRFVNHIGTNGGRRRLVEDLAERCHAGVLQYPVEDDLVPDIVRQEARMTQIRRDAAGNGELAMASTPAATVLASAVSGGGLAVAGDGSCAAGNCA